MLRFAALGDSITLGIGDPLPQGGWRGWAALLAGALGTEGNPPQLYNLAVSGARIVDLPGGQLGQALRLRPHVASVVAGVNDTLRGRFDVDAVQAALTETVVALHAAGAVVLTARLPEPGRLLPLPASLARPLARRIAAINAIADGVAHRFATVHVDLAAPAGSADRRMWSVDRLHPSERGHRLLARCFADALAATGFPVVARPALQPQFPPPTRRAQAWWMATRGVKWLLDRSTDLLPQLVGIALAEWWQTVRGETDPVDETLAPDGAEQIA
jgi:lysophospholipase L1-like esterase